MNGDFAELEAVISDLIQDAIGRVYTGSPGVVLAFAPSTQTASIRLEPALRIDGVAKPVATLADVPVAFVGSMTVPVKAGDRVWVAFGHRSLDAWKESGGAVDPKSTRTHALSDAVAFVWAPRPVKVALADFDNVNVEIRERDAGGIRLGKGASLAAARQGDAIEISLSAVQLAALATAQTVAAAWIASGSIPPPPPPFTMSGTITGGSDVVKVK